MTWETEASAHGSPHRWLLLTRMWWNATQKVHRTRLRYSKSHAFLLKTHNVVGNVWEAFTFDASSVLFFSFFFKMRLWIRCGGRWISVEDNTGHVHRLYGQVMMQVMSLSGSCLLVSQNNVKLNAKVKWQKKERQHTWVLNWPACSSKYSPILK